MKTGNQCTTDMFKFLTEQKTAKAAETGYSWLADVNIYKDDDKPITYKGQYIAINCLPFVYGKAVNDSNVMNVNLHAPKLSDGTADRTQLNKLVTFIESLFPIENGTEDVVSTQIGGAYYDIHSISNPMEDKDETYFINIRLSLTFNSL